jgi:hydroxyacylglutathione hydrolase
MSRSGFRSWVCATLFTLGALGGAGAAEAPSTLFAQPWNGGLDEREPAFQAQRIDDDTIVIRQSIRTTFEAPFVHLLFGKAKALLIDTGTGSGDLRAEVDRIIGARLKARGQQSLPLVVMHSHAHSDHVGGDAGFAGRADTIVVGHTADDVARFFGIKAWPTEAAAFDLGERIVDILPTPGHHDSHVMAFDRATRILFSGDSIYPGNLYFRCDKAQTFKASLDRVAAFAAKNDVRWLLGAHIEMTTSPGKTFAQDDKARRHEHVLELPPSIIGEVRDAVAKMVDRPRVTAYDAFVLFPHPADPRGKQPPDWCL